MNWIKNWSFRRAASCLTGLWAFLMLTAFPLYAKERYARMGVHKFEFFLAISVACLLPAALFYTIGKFLSCRIKTSAGSHCGGKEDVACATARGRIHAPRRALLSGLDLAMLCYLAACCLSWAVGVDRREGWTGVSGWFMGLRTQLLFVLIYFLASRGLSLGAFWKRALLTGHFLGSGAVFLLGVLHRFGLDPLDMYRGLDESWQLLFLSTIGQASWYSAYVCVALAPGAALFFSSGRPRVRVAAGAYCALGFATVVTQNSDSAFAAMAALLFVLFLAACDGPDRMERFFETVLLMLGSFKAVGILQEIFPKQAVRLEGVSEFLSQSTATWIAFLAVCLLYMGFLFWRQKHPQILEFECKRRLRAGAWILSAGALLCYALAVWLNTTGILEKLLGIRSENQYLLFDRFWGNSRGFTWKFTLEAFGELPFGRKLTGVGPDCFSAWCYGDLRLAGELDHFFGADQMLTNAHNEWLNALFCLGILGLAAYLAIFAVSFRRFFAAGSASWLGLAAAAGVLVYAAHNFFCYQQICCAPYLFLLLGLAENVRKISGNGAHRTGGFNHTTS